MAPEVEYEQRRAERVAEQARLEARQGRFSQARLATALAGVFLFWLAFVHHGASPAWLVIPIVGFVALAVRQEGELRRLGAVRRAARFYELGLKRLRGEWAGTGESGARFRDAGHAYAESLDLFGQGSLFELLCSARTRAGEDALAAWLSGPAEPEVVRERQRRVAELRPELALRESLWLAGEDLRAAVHPEKLAAWGEAPAVEGLLRHRALAYVLPALTVAGLVIWGVFEQRVLFLAAALLQAGYLYSLRAKLELVLGQLDQPSKELGLLAALLEELERAPAARGLPSPEPLRRLARLVALAEMPRNQFFIPIAAVLLWNVHCAVAIEGWRRRHGAEIRRWLEALGEFEALNSLAGYAWEHPSDPFPELLAGPARVEGVEMAHPLLAGRAVANSLTVGGEAPLVVISGSNMSGKSTLLRTLGVNVVLALAGAPVRARCFRLTPLRVGASIRVVDSLQEGQSRFFAEIRQLRLLVELSGGEVPLLFLLDELLSGTNSHDRRIGAAGILEGLRKRGAIGAVTTHDLALTQIPALNVHFEDRIEEGRVLFDYTLRPGVVAKSNALELMRSIGLDV